MISVQGLSKTFAGPVPVEAVKDVTFEAQRGEVFGLLGANGAGKTTTLRMLVTLLAPDRGTIQINGFDVATHPHEVRRSIGFLSVTTGLYERLTARELLVSFGHLQGIDHAAKRADALIERFGIQEFAHQRCGRLSTGMKQKVSIARALMHDPPVLVLDEPTVGLDVLVAQAFLEAVEEARDEGRCVIYSTHIMSEVERLCDRVALIHMGQIIDRVTTASMIEAYGTVEAAFIDKVGSAS